MPKRWLPFINGDYYHVFNRGTARQPVYSNKRDYDRFLLTLAYYQYENPSLKLSRFLTLPHLEQLEYLSLHHNPKEKLVEIICYCLMPNHFHLILRQVLPNGISKFMRQVLNSYTRFYNAKHERPGPLFQGSFKAILIETDEQLIHLSRYIHLNPLVSGVVRDIDFLDFPWTSFKVILQHKSALVNAEPILSHFSSIEDYKTFVLDQASYARELEKVKYLTLEEI